MFMVRLLGMNIFYVFLVEVVMSKLKYMRDVFNVFLVFSCILLWLCIMKLMEDRMCMILF